MCLLLSKPGRIAVYEGTNSKRGGYEGVRRATMKGGGGGIGKRKILVLIKCGLFMAFYLFLFVCFLFFLIFIDLFLSFLFLFLIIFFLPQHIYWFS